MKQRMNTTSRDSEVIVSKFNRLAVACSAFMGGLLCISSVAEATDMQIYAAPLAGEKTIVMMLDTSGSMGSIDSNTKNNYSNKDDFNSIYKDYKIGRNCRTDQGGNYEYSSTTPQYVRKFCTVSYSTSQSSDYWRLKDRCEVLSNNRGLRCYDRLTRLKDGIFEFLNNTTNTKLQTTKVGLGNFSVNGDGESGQILVPAVALGKSDSAQRLLLKQKVADLVAIGGTPSAHAYAEAAAYLMGTATTGGSNLQAYFQLSGYNNYRICYGWSSDGSCSEGWSGYYNGSVPNGYTRGEKGRLNGYDGYYYYGVNPYLSGISGFASSASDTKNDTKTKYKSPLPETPVSCDGQGIYFLSDGVPNGSSDSEASSIMSVALETTSFSCSGGLSNTNSASGWACMGEFAKKLYNANSNPAKVSIVTAFVGFGSDFNDVGSSSDVRNACRLSSRTQLLPDGSEPNDICSPTSKSGYAMPKPGYGNGGFYPIQGSSEVANSVLDFISKLPSGPIKPLATGAVAVPIDSLDPSSYQSQGYLRALEPNPANPVMVWTGNLKKYEVVGGALKDGSNAVFDSNGKLNTNTKDLWNTTGSNDNGDVRLGGAYSRLLMPTASNSALIRPLFTDVASVSAGTTLNKMSKGALLSVPATTVADSADVLNQFKTKAVLKDFPLLVKLKLLNYLGYDVDLASTALPTELTAPAEPFVSMGGSVHSFPLQLTYSGKLDNDTGDLTSVRSQSILYGSAEGGIRIVKAGNTTSTVNDAGVEQMVFVPADILSSSSSAALRKGQSGSLSAGMDSTWAADAAYKVTSTSGDETSVTARQMNVYGGMRMGGKSYYGLDVLTPSNPKMLFRIGSDQTDFDRMGQTWSKPVLANVRYAGEIKRVIFVGGGYDMCYENPRFVLGSSTNSTTDYPDTTCNNVNGSKTRAEGNAVYMIDATTGKRLWWTSNTGSDTNNAELKHSIPSRVSTMDRDGDGLVDHLYFGDLGGQIFRADFNNAKTVTSANGFGVRVVRMAELGESTARTKGDQPRFYQAPTVTFHVVGLNRFIVLGIASGDRSTPLDVTPAIGRDSMLPAKPLSGRPDNNVYGIIDRDFAKKNLITASGTLTLESKDKTMASLQKDPQLLNGVLSSTFFSASGSGKDGWYRSLSTLASGARVANASNGGMKAFEEDPIAITNRLIIPVYDPDGKVSTSSADPCSIRIIGETVLEQYCLPFGACTKSDGTVDSTFENTYTGYLTDNVVGSGITGASFASLNDSNNPKCVGEKCFTLLSPKGIWRSREILNPVKWYEKNIEGTE